MLTIAWLFGKQMHTLLDYGAAVNAVTEEEIVGCINEARRKGMEASDPTYPIVQLERFHRQEMWQGLQVGIPWGSLAPWLYEWVCTEMAKMRC